MFIFIFFYGLKILSLLRRVEAGDHWHEAGAQVLWRADLEDGAIHGALRRCREVAQDKVGQEGRLLHRAHRDDAVDNVLALHIGEILLQERRRVLLFRV